ncbi:MAG TPA: hydroxyacid dehydrogenase [Spirochaetia bacterium]|nr:hydroxyacid dehydrogenase [Spirochaetia bacterium]
MSGRVLIPQDVAETGKQYLRERGYEIKSGSGTSVEAISHDVADCDAILARTAPFPSAVLDAAPKLKVIARHGVGVDNIDLERAAELGIWVTNAPASNSNTVAEHTLTLILALAKKLIPAAAAFRAGDFEARNRLKGMDLEGKTLGIVGMGKIGKLVATKAGIGLGMRIVGFDAYVPADAFPEGVERSATLEELLGRSDFVTLHVPATPETKDYIGKQEIACMKPSAYLINAARGEILDETALIEALQAGRIAGAGLDVFREEPPAKNNPLFAMENVVATPHNAALTAECMERMAVHAAMGIDDVLSGRTPQWPVVTPRNPRQR